MATQSAKAADAATNEDLAKQIDQLRTDLSDLGDILKSLTKQRVEETKGRAASAARHAQDRGREVLDEAAATLEGLEDQAVRTVREKPAQSLAIAAGLGLLVGYLMNRR